MTISDAPTTRVVLFQARAPQDKLQHLILTARYHFERKEHLILFVEDEKTALFVDDLLWKSPPTSFLPHTLSDTASADLILITKAKINLNGAKYAFNLCPTPLLVEGPFKIIYDFEDLTSPHRKQLSESRFDTYKQNRYLIESRI